MTKTQRLLKSHLIIILAPLLLSACGDKGSDTGEDPVTEEGIYPLNIEEDTECPSIEEVNALLPEEEFNCSGQRFIEVTEFIEKYDYPYYIDGSNWEEEEDPDGDHCTYKGTYEAGAAPEWCASVGRPMVRDGEQVSAESRPAQNKDWRKHKIRVGVEGLSEAQKKTAGEFYLKNALMEHASVAAFHHFALELMKFGAPAELLELTHVAISDELRHAKQAFALAADLLGSATEPGTMPLDLKLSKDIVELAETVAREAAINETLAVLLAAEQLRHAKDPAIRAFLEGVIRDESRHAELAWSTLRWCIEVGGEDVRKRLREIMMEAPKIGSADFPAKGINSLGLCSRQKIESAIAQGMTRVVRPSFESLLNG